jgi:hypothetical protein
MPFCSHWEQTDAFGIHHVHVQKTVQTLLTSRSINYLPTHLHKAKETDRPVSLMLKLQVNRIFIWDDRSQVPELSHIIKAFICYPYVMTTASNMVTEHKTVNVDT